MCEKITLTNISVLFGMERLRDVDRTGTRLWAQNSGYFSYDKARKFAPEKFCTN